MKLLVTIFFLVVSAKNKNKPLYIATVIAVLNISGTNFTLQTFYIFTE